MAPNQTAFGVIEDCWITRRPYTVARLGRVLDWYPRWGGIELLVGKPEATLSFEQ